MMRARISGWRVRRYSATQSIGSGRARDRSARPEISPASSRSRHALTESHSISPNSRRSGISSASTLFVGDVHRFRFGVDDHGGFRAVMEMGVEYHHL